MGRSPVNQDLNVDVRTCEYCGSTVSDNQVRSMMPASWIDKSSVRVCACCPPEYQKTADAPWLSETKNFERDVDVIYGGMGTGDRSHLIKGGNDD